MENTDLSKFNFKREGFVVLNGTTCSPDGTILGYIDLFYSKNKEVFHYRLDHLFSAKIVYVEGIDDHIEITPQEQAAFFAKKIDEKGIVNLTLWSPINIDN